MDQDTIEYLKSLGISVARGVPQLASGFVDLAALPFTLSGLIKPEQAFGSTDWMTAKGYLPPKQEGLLSETTELLSGAINPAGAIAGGLLGIGSIAAKGAKPVLSAIDNSLYPLTKEEFLGTPKIVSTSNSRDLKPLELTTNKNLSPEPFMGGKFDMKMSEDGAVVLKEGKPIASYNFGDTLVVDPKYRKQGIAQELVYQFRKKYPQQAQATTRTKASQQIQEKVWDRIEQENLKSIYGY